MKRKITEEKLLANQVFVYTLKQENNHYWISTATWQHSGNHKYYLVVVGGFGRARKWICNGLVNPGHVICPTRARHTSCPAGPLPSPHVQHVFHSHVRNSFTPYTRSHTPTRPVRAKSKARTHMHVRVFAHTREIRGLTRTRASLSFSCRRSSVFAGEASIFFVFRYFILAS